MNSLKILVNSLESIYHPSKSSSYDLPPSSPLEVEDIIDNDQKLPQQVQQATIVSQPSKLPQKQTVSPPSSNTTSEDEEIEHDDLEIDLSKQKTTPLKHRRSLVKTLFSIAFQVVFFLPNYLLIKPLLLIWFIITFPFVYTGQILGLLNDDDDEALMVATPESETEPSSEYSNSRRSSRSNSTTPSIMEEDEPESQQSEDQYNYTNNDLHNSHRHHTHKSSSASTSAADNRSFIDDKTEQIKQENIFSNKIKSPTASSKYIIPPPQRLYPLIRNPQKRKRKTLILDLDETLIHSLSRGSPRSFSSTSSYAPKMIEIKLNNMATLYYVHKRPYCDYFLQEISKWFELQIFTASVKEYADPIIDWLESDIIEHQNKTKNNNNNNNNNSSNTNSNNTNSNNKMKQLEKSGDDEPPKVFTKRYYRNDCTFRPGVGYIKDLSKYIRDEELKNVIILDNSPISYALHEDNAVMIEGWINDQSDRDLLNLLPMLHSLSLCIDVRFILGLRNGERSFEREIRKA
ncbi:HAD-like domain-containing protein [Scheffersomyces amazonensis]|uniref:HAD-like domain-containing protein n=1 Tax=Scheffersomyces amazonensis TaxID=1078765 RepID=UPI00315D2D6A